MNEATRHILCISGGKDSASLALYLRDKVRDMEYVFCDTGKELPDTYAYLPRLEAALGRPITVLKDDQGFDYWLSVFGGYLPSPRMRWCTRHLKLKPFERYVGDTPVVSYVGIRADEERNGYVSTKPNIRSVFPFKEDGVAFADVKKILDESGVGMPTYRSWRSRSGCFFCFFQQKIEWVGLLENYEDLYWQASRYEKVDDAIGSRFTWCDNESLEELARPERISAVKEEHARRMSRKTPSRLRLADQFGACADPAACLICTL